MHKKFRNPPVFYVICKVHFNIIAKMARWADDIQELFRKEEQFLDYEPQSNNETRQRWEYRTFDKRTRYLLERDSLCLVTLDYNSFVSFRSLMLSGLEKVHATAHLDRISRIGLRYLNAFAIPEKKEPGDYLVSGVCGFVPAIARKGLDICSSETRTSEEDIAMVHRSCFGSKGLLLQNDIDPGIIAFSPKLQELAKQKRVVTIDTDCFSENSFLYDTGKISRKLNDLHARCESAFRESLTDKARKDWGEYDAE